MDVCTSFLVPYAYLVMCNLKRHLGRILIFDFDFCRIAFLCNKKKCVFCYFDLQCQYKGFRVKKIKILPRWSFSLHITKYAYQKWSRSTEPLWLYSSICVQKYNLRETAKEDLLESPIWPRPFVLKLILQLYWGRSQLFDIHSLKADTFLHQTKEEKYWPKCKIISGPSP